MAGQTARASILEVLPFDVINQIICKSVDDEPTLKALSEASRALREIALPRLRSHTVLLNIFEMSHLTESFEMSPAAVLMNDFIHERNNRKASQIRVLEIRDQLEPISRISSEKYARSPAVIMNAMRGLVELFYEFLKKCTGVRKVLRDGYEHAEFNTVELVSKLLELPNLKILCLKIHQDRQWRYNETPVFELYEQNRSQVEDESKGLACLSLALPMTLNRHNWKSVWTLCRQILVSNIKTLQHLYFDGPDLEMITDGMQDNALKSMCLKSLRFRMRFDHHNFLRVLGLGSPRPDSGNWDTNTALTSLRHLELWNSFEIADDYDTVYNSFLNSIYTPNLKKTQVFSIHQLNYGSDAELVLWLRSFQGLEVVQFKARHLDDETIRGLHILADVHGRTLHTITLRQIYLNSLDCLCRFRHEDFPALRRLEMIQRDTTPFMAMDVLFKALSSLPQIKEFKYTANKFSRNNREPTGLILNRPTLSSMYATGFFFRNLFSETELQRSYSYPSTNTNYCFSTNVLTYYRRLFRDAFRRAQEEDTFGNARTSLPWALVNAYISHLYFLTGKEPMGEYYPRLGQLEFEEKQKQSANTLAIFMKELPASLQSWEVEYITQQNRRGPIERCIDMWKKEGEVWAYHKELKLLPAF